MSTTNYLAQSLVDQWAAFIDGVNVDGEGDRGIDVRTSRGGGFQVKSSVYYTEHHFAKEILAKLPLVPVVVGLPDGDPEEVRKALNKKGYWVNPNIEEDSSRLPELVRRVRALGTKEVKV